MKISSFLGCLAGAALSGPIAAALPPMGAVSAYPMSCEATVVASVEAHRGALDAMADLLDQAEQGGSVEAAAAGFQELARVHEAGMLADEAACGGFTEERDEILMSIGDHFSVWEQAAIEGRLEALGVEVR